MRETPARSAREYPSITKALELPAALVEANQWDSTDDWLNRAHRRVIAKTTGFPSESNYGNQEGTSTLETVTQTMLGFELERGGRAVALKSQLPSPRVEGRN